MKDGKTTKRSLKDLPQLPGLTKTHLFPFLRQIDYSNLSITNKSWNVVANPIEGVRLYLENLKKQPQNLRALRNLFNYISNHCPNPNDPNLRRMLENIKVPPKISDDTSMLAWEWKLCDYAEPRDSKEHKKWKKELTAIANKVSHLQTAHFGDLETEYPKIIRRINNLANLPFDQQRKMQEALTKVSNINSEASLFKVMKIYFGIEGANNTKAQNALWRLFALSKSKHTAQRLDKEDFILQFDIMRKKIIKVIDEAERASYPKQYIYGIGTFCVGCLTAGSFGGYAYMESNNFPQDIRILAMIGLVTVLPLIAFGILGLTGDTWKKKNKSLQDDRILSILSEILGNQANINPHATAAPSA